jgi:hypothetical protein
LRDARRNGRAGLYASQVGARMYDNLALFLRSLRLALGRRLGRLKLVVVALVEESCYAQAECLALGPAAIGEGRVVGCGRGEMPCFVSGVKTRAVPLDFVSICVGGVRRVSTYLAMTTTAGPLAMAAKKFRLLRAAM